jgi:cellulose synthase/poly-beta-1,6-N-acetylglucosamine synthase-like glycosyltransferase
MILIIIAGFTKRLLTLLGVTDTKVYGKIASNVLEYDVELPLVSVIVTTRNEKDTIEESIISIFEQSHPNFELIVIDARSNDGTFEKAVELEVVSRSYRNCKRYLFSSRS